MDETCSDLFIDEYWKKQGKVIPPDDMEDVQQKMKTEGLCSVKSYMKSKLGDWKSQPLNCSIIGSTGSGKSSLINAIRGLSTQDENAASVGVVECTPEPKSYPDPKNPMLQYWDLPGVGTTKFPKNETYLQKIGFRRYDFFFIITAGRFREDDIWLATQIREAGKTFFFVRSKIDLDLWNEKQCRGDKFNAEAVMEKIRNHCVEKLQTQFKSPEVFLISNFHPQMYEFSSLCLKLIKSLSQLKREAMTLSLRSLSNTMIAEKLRTLRNRVWFVSFMSALGASIPVSGVSMAIDVSLLLYELQLHREQFVIGKEMLASLSQKVNPGVLEKIKWIQSIGTEEHVISLFSSYVNSIRAEEICRAIPGFGTLIACGFSFGTTHQMLSGHLDLMETISNGIMELTLKEMIDAVKLD